MTAALFSGNEAIVDPWLLAMTHVYGMEVAGVEIMTGCEVLGVRREGGGWTVDTGRGAIQAACVVNCGGNQGDQVEIMLEKVFLDFVIALLSLIIRNPPSPSPLAKGSTLS